MNNLSFHIGYELSREEVELFNIMEELVKRWEYERKGFFEKLKDKIFNRKGK